MLGRPDMISVVEHQDALQVVELRAQEAEIKALQLENEVRASLLNAGKFLSRRSLRRLNPQISDPVEFLFPVD